MTKMTMPASLLLAVLGAHGEVDTSRRLAITVSADCEAACPGAGAANAAMDASVVTTGVVGLGLALEGCVETLDQGAQRMTSNLAMDTCDHRTALECMAGSGLASCAQAPLGPLCLVRDGSCAPLGPDWANCGSHPVSGTCFGTGGNIPGPNNVAADPCPAPNCLEIDMLTISDCCETSCPGARLAGIALGASMAATVAETIVLGLAGTTETTVQTNARTMTNLWTGSCDHRTALRCVDSSTECQRCSANSASDNALCFESTCDNPPEWATVCEGGDNPADYTNSGNGYNSGAVSNRHVSLVGLVVLVASLMTVGCI